MANILTKLKDTGAYVLLHGLLTYWIKQNAYLNKILETKPVTFNEFKQAINSLLEFSATSELSKSKALANEYFKLNHSGLKAHSFNWRVGTIKSALTVKKLAV